MYPVFRNQRDSSPYIYWSALLFSISLFRYKTIITIIITHVPWLSVITTILLATRNEIAQIRSEEVRQYSSRCQMYSMVLIKISDRCKEIQSP